MKAKVERAFIDKETNTAHKVGEVVDLKDTRFKDLKEKGFVVENILDQKAEVETLKKENSALKTEITKLNAEIAELKAIIEKAANASK